MYVSGSGISAMSADISKGGQAIEKAEGYKEEHGQVRSS
jgi:hypothetical protein